jgi:hypothetical protein
LLIQVMLCKPWINVRNSIERQSMSSPNEILRSLTTENSSWTAIGRTLDKLEQLSNVTADGKAWQTVVRDHLAERSIHVSLGHLNKIRRTYAFLKSAIDQLNLKVDHMDDAPISALEVAEKLSHLDRSMGLQAAADILTKAATYVEINARYTEYLAAHPENMTPRQAAWRTRKNSKSGKSVPIATEPTISSRPTLKVPSSFFISDEISKQMADLLEHVWHHGKAAGLDEAKHLLRDSEVQIEELQKQVAIYKETAKEFEVQMKITYCKYLECMGKDYEVDWDKYFGEDS